MEQEEEGGGEGGEEVRQGERGVEEEGEEEEGQGGRRAGIREPPGHRQRGHKVGQGCQQSHLAKGSDWWTGNKVDKDYITW